MVPPRNQNKKSSKNKRSKKNSSRMIHFKDILTDPSNGNAFALGTNANGRAVVNHILAPVAIRAIQPNDGVIYTSVESRYSMLRQAVTGWEEYRIASATLEFVSTNPNSGLVHITSSSDPSDRYSLSESDPFANLAQTAGNGNAQSLNRSNPIRHNLDIDSSWKKVQSQLQRRESENRVVAITTISDAAFGMYSINVLNAPANTVVGVIWINFALEVRGPRLNSTTN